MSSSSESSSVIIIGDNRAHAALAVDRDFSDAFSKTTEVTRFPSPPKIGYIVQLRTRSGPWRQGEFIHLEQKDVEEVCPKMLRAAIFREGAFPTELPKDLRAKWFETEVLSGEVLAQCAKEMRVFAVTNTGNFSRLQNG